MTTAELATRILSQLGFSTAVTMEPSADYRRDKIVEMIDEQKAQWRREVLVELGNEAESNGNFVLAHQLKERANSMAASQKVEPDKLVNPAGY